MVSNSEEDEELKMLEMEYDEFKKKTKNELDQKKDKNERWNRNKKWKRNKEWNRNKERKLDLKKNDVIVSDKIKRKLIKDRPSSPLNSRIIEFWPKNTLPLFKRNGDIFCVNVEEKWWIFKIDLHFEECGGILSYKNGSCINNDFESYKIIKDCVIYVMNDGLDDFYCRIRVCPSMKHDKLAIFNIDQALRLRRESMNAAVGNYVVHDDIHWTLSLLNEKYGPWEESEKFIYSLPRCGWYIKRKNN